MRLNAVSFAIASVIVVAAVAYPQVPATPRKRQVPDLTLQVHDSTAADFAARIGDYSEFRNGLEQGVPRPIVTDDPAETRMAVQALAARIRAARAGASQGDIFRPATSVQFKRALLHETDTSTCAKIMDDDNPGELPIQINGAYAEGKPLSTMPVNVLAVLPALPEDVEYRFLGRTLILLDTRANVVLDWIPGAIECTECGRGRCRREVAISAR